MSGRKGKRGTEDLDDSGEGGGAGSADGGAMKRQRRPSSKITDYNDAEIDELLKQADVDTGKPGSRKGKPGRPPKESYERAAGGSAEGAGVGAGAAGAGADARSVAVHDAPRFTLQDILSYQQLMQHYAQLQVAAHSLVLQAQAPSSPAAPTVGQAVQISHLVSGAVGLLQQVLAMPAAQAIIAAATAATSSAAGGSAGTAATGDPSMSAGAEGSDPK